MQLYHFFLQANSYRNNNRNSHGYIHHYATSTKPRVLARES